MDQLVGGKNDDMISVDPSSTSDRSWLSPVAANREETILRSVAGLGTSSTATRIDALVERYRALSGNQVITKKDAERGILRALKARGISVECPPQTQEKFDPNSLNRLVD